MATAALVAVAAVEAVASAAPSPPASPTHAPTVEPTPVVSAADLEDLGARRLRFPVPAVSPAAVRDSFRDRRGSGPHEAMDVVAPHGAAVVAVDDGVVAKLFESVPGGRTMYLFDVELRFAYYYAHLDAYAPGLTEGQRVRKGDVIATVGTSGDAGDAGPHLHFAIFKLEPAPRWWRGTALNPYPFFVPPLGER
jgi:murein DD-endopeptidase MepM/ murein hydrolase activator NlpD